MMQQSSGFTKEQWMEEGQQHFQEQRYQEALAAYNQVIEVDPTYAPAQYHKGEALRSLYKKKRALAAYEKATELDPGYAAAYFAKGGVLRLLRWYRKALIAFEQAAVLDPQNARFLLHWGLALDVLKRHQEALAVYDRVLALDSSRLSAAAQMRKGKIFQNLKRYEEALAAYDRAIEIDPDYGRAYSQKADLLKDLQRYEEALKIYEQFVQDPLTSLSYLVHKGELLCLLKRYDEALVTYQRLIEVDFDDAWRYLHGEMLSHPPPAQEVLAMYEQLIQQDSNIAGVYSIQGEILYKLARPEEARVAYERSLAICEQAIEQEPTGFAYYLKGLALQALERIAETNEAFQQEQELRAQGRFLAHRNAGNNRS